MLQSLKERPLLRSIALVAGGTAAAQAIAMAFAPVITRLYGPEPYGNQSVFLSVTNLVATVAALSYPIAIVLPSDDRAALALARLSVYVGVATSVLAAAVILVVGPRLLALLNAQSIAGLSYLIPVAMMIAVAGAVTNHWAIRKKAYALTAKAAVAAAVLTGLIKVGVGFVKPTAATLIVANLVSGLLGAALLMVGFRRASSQAGVVGPPRGRSPTAWEVAKEHRDFALLRTPQILVNTVSQSLPVLMLSAYFGSATAGYYALAAAVLAMPVTLIGGAVFQVFYPRINEAIQQGEDARALLVKATRSMALVGVVPFIAVAVAGPFLFRVVFGTAWGTAGVYARWLSVWLFCQYINRPAVAAIPPLRLQGGLLVYELVSTATKLVALYVGYVLLGSDVAGIALFSVSGALSYLWLIGWVVSRSGARRSPQAEAL